MKTGETEMIREKLEKKVKEQTEELLHTSINRESGLFWYTVHGVNYHSAMESGIVHSVRESLSWIPAYLFLNREDGSAFELAARGIGNVLALQDKNPESPTYGIWPYLFEEPLDKMKNPDWNWGPFLGASLIVLLQEDGEKLPAGLTKEMKEALVRACESIIRRNMGVDYTNISLMSAEVLVLAGELLGNTDFFERGLHILKEQLAFVEANGGYAEYNSPTYGVLDIEETGRILYYAKDREVRETAEKLHGLGWKVFAEHYHPATGQIAPPHARCYQDIQGNEIRTLITIGTDGACELEPYENWHVNTQWLFVTLQCPEEYWHYFQDRDAVRILEEDFYRGVDTIADEQIRVLVEKGTPPLTSYTYFTPKYCMGTFRRHDMWNQRRPLMAYFQTEEGSVCFRVRCMHDNMDFAGAMLETVQEKNTVAAGVGFVTDHGDYHYILTPVVDGKITADRFSLDFAAEGALGQVEIRETESAEHGGWDLVIGEHLLHLGLLEAVFGEEQVRVEKIDEEGKKGIRLILFEGQNRELDFHKLKEAYAAFWLTVTKEGETSDLRGRIQRTEGKTFCCLGTQDEELERVELQTKPGLYLQPTAGEKKQFKCGGFYYVKE